MNKYIFLALIPVAIYLTFSFVAMDLTWIAKDPNEATLAPVARILLISLSMLSVAAVIEYWDR